MAFFKKILASIKESMSPPVFHIKGRRQKHVSKRTPKKIKRAARRHKPKKHKVPLRRAAKPKKAARKPAPKPKKIKFKKPSRAKAVSKLRTIPKEKPLPSVGEITHYFSRIGVCVIKVTAGEIRVGDRLQIRGHTTKFAQSVRSLQIENENVNVGRRGELVGLKIDKRARAGDRVFKLV